MIEFMFLWVWLASIQEHICSKDIDSLRAYVWFLEGWRAVALYFRSFKPWYFPRATATLALHESSLSLIGGIVMPIESIAPNSGLNAPSSRPLYKLLHHAGSARFNFSKDEPRSGKLPV